MGEAPKKSEPYKTEINKSGTTQKTREIPTAETKIDKLRLYDIIVKYKHIVYDTIVKLKNA